MPNPSRKPATIATPTTTASRARAVRAKAATAPTAATATTATIVPLEPDDELLQVPDGAAATAGQPAPISQVMRVATKPVAVAWPRPTVDEWGRDAQVVGLLAPLAHLRWDISVGGQHHLPKGAALVVVNTRRMALTPLSTALALSEALDRPVRFVGRPDFVPFGPLLRRVGGLLTLPEEIGGALRAGEIVVLGARATANPRHAGKVDHTFVAAAIREAVPVHVAATLSTMFSRHARVEVAAALRSSRHRRGPLAEVELAEHAQHRLQELLDEMGGTQTGIPALDLLGEG